MLISYNSSDGRKLMSGSSNISSTEFVYKEATNYSKPVFFNLL